MISKWLEFVKVKTKLKTKVYLVKAKWDGTELGIIKWYTNWRKYCFHPTIDIETVHSDRCLLEISQYITHLNEEHRWLKL